MASSRRFKAVIFDLDDTLYSERDYVISGFWVVARYLADRLNINCQVIFQSLLFQFEESTSQVFNRLLAGYRMYDSKLIQECIDIYRSHYPSIGLHIKAKEVLDWLKSNHIKIGIITDGRPEGQRNKIKALGLEQYCNSIIITDELGGVEFRKPNEVPYRKVLTDLNIKPEESVYVGDNPAKDFITANRLGIYTIMVNTQNGIYSQMNYPAEYLARCKIKCLCGIKKIVKAGV